jgi:hypothetical protein
MLSAFFSTIQQLSFLMANKLGLTDGARSDSRFSEQTSPPHRQRIRQALRQIAAYMEDMGLGRIDPGSQTDRAQHALVPSRA